MYWRSGAFLVERWRIGLIVAASGAFDREDLTMRQLAQQLGGIPVLDGGMSKTAHEMEEWPLPKAVAPSP
jgi:hypothetical protein